jgi:hypothetical protein
MVPVQEVALAHVVPHISYTGSYPLTPLIDGAAAPFTVEVDVVLWVPSAAAEGATISVGTSWTTAGPVTKRLDALPQGETTVRVALPAAEKVRIAYGLWLPHS